MDYSVNAFLVLLKVGFALVENIKQLKNIPNFVNNVALNLLNLVFEDIEWAILN